MTVFCEAGIQEQTARSQHFLARGKCDVDIAVLSYESVRNAVCLQISQKCVCDSKEFLLAMATATST